MPETREALRVAASESALQAQVGEINMHDHGPRGLSDFRSGAGRAGPDWRRRSGAG